MKVDTQVADNNSLTRCIDTRNAWACVGVVAAAILMIWPVAEMPYGDDTAYTYVALNVARSGHLIYNGWESALLVLHAYWGALFIRLFGFSFTWVRFSSLPFALGAVGFCYFLLRRGLEMDPIMAGLRSARRWDSWVAQAVRQFGSFHCLFYLIWHGYGGVRLGSSSLHS